MDWPEDGDVAVVVVVGVWVEMRVWISLRMAEYQDRSWERNMRSHIPVVGVN